MVSVITGRTVREEATEGKFDLVKWIRIRARKLKWLSHILRMGPDRKVKQAIFEMFSTLRHHNEET